MIFTISGILLLMYSLVNYKKALMLYVLFQIFWYGDIILLPNITLNMLITTCFMLVYVIKRKKYKNNNKMPFTIPFIMIALSMIITCFFSLVGFQNEFKRVISFLIQNLVILWIMWNVFNSKKDAELIIKGVTYVIFFAVIYGLFESLIQYNPILEYKIHLSFGNITAYKLNTARGYRLSSIFEHPIGAGMTFGLYFVFILSNYINDKHSIPNRKLALLTAMLCIPCIILTKMRSTMVFTIIASLGILNLKKKITYRIVILGVLFLCLLFPLISDNSLLFISMFNKKAQGELSGSSLDLRIDQFYSIYKIFLLSPIGGLGERFQTVISSSYLIGTLGFESIWFVQMATHGLMGIIAYAALLVVSVIIVPMKYKSKKIFFLTLAYWITYTATTIPYFRTILYYLAIFYYIKHQQNEYYDGIG